MCNLYRLEKGPDAIRKLFDAAHIGLGFPDGIPNFEPRDIHITDRAPIVRAARDTPGAAELVERRWSWPGPNGKPVYNLRSEGREFGVGRCLVLADGFYEYSAPADPKQKRKDRWRFSPSDGEPFAIAGFMRTVPDIDEAFSLLTTTPSSDVEPYHGRQIVLMRLAHWARWLDTSAAVDDLLRPLPDGSLKVEAA